MPNFANIAPVMTDAAKIPGLFRETPQVPLATALGARVDLSATSFVEYDAFNEPFFLQYY